MLMMGADELLDLLVGDEFSSLDFLKRCVGDVVRKTLLRQQVCGRRGQKRHRDAFRCQFGDCDVPLGRATTNSDLGFDPFHKLTVSELDFCSRQL